MRAVSDTSPLCYLCLIGSADLLPRLFDEVFVPDAVNVELNHPRVPATVRSWLSQWPSWLKVQPISGPPNPLLEFRLDPGEREAIALAQEMKVGQVLLDDQAVRRVASSRGMVVTGTLGILVEAARRGWIDLPQAIGDLRRTNFRATPAFLAAILQQHARQSP